MARPRNDGLVKIEIITDRKPWTDRPHDLGKVVSVTPEIADDLVMRGFAKKVV